MSKTVERLLEQPAALSELTWFQERHSGNVVIELANNTLPGGLKVALIFDENVTQAGKEELERLIEMGLNGPKTDFTVSLNTTHQESAKAAMCVEADKAEILLTGARFRFRIGQYPNAGEVNTRRLQLIHGDNGTHQLRLNAPPESTPESRANHYRE